MILCNKWIHCHTKFTFFDNQPTIGRHGEPGRCSAGFRVREPIEREGNQLLNDMGMSFLVGTPFWKNEGKTKGRPLLVYKGEPSKRGRPILEVAHVAPWCKALARITGHRYILRCSWRMWLGLHGFVPLSVCLELQRTLAGDMQGLGKCVRCFILG